MSEKDTFNRGGMVFFAVAFIGTLVFFGFTLCINPGGIDRGGVVEVKFSKAEADARTTEWKQTSPENIAYGKGLYSTNCAFCHSSGGGDAVLDRLAKGESKFGLKPLQLYSSIRIGWAGTHKLAHIPEREKWALVAFLRSLNPSGPDDSSSEWKNFLAQGKY